MRSLGSQIFLQYIIDECSWQENVKFSEDGETVLEGEDID